MIIFLLYFFRISRLYIAKEPYNSTKQYKLTLSDLFLMETLFFAHDLPRKKPSPLLDARAVFFPHFFIPGCQANDLTQNQFSCYVLKNIFSGCPYPHLQMWATKSPSFFWGTTLHFLSRKKLLKIIGCGRLGSPEEEETSFPAQSGNCS